MKTQERIIRSVTAQGDARELEAEVTYLVTRWHEARPYGTGAAYEEHSEFAVEYTEYLTEDLTAEERKQLDDKINEGHYE